MRFVADAENSGNNFFNPNAAQLQLAWSARNLTASLQARINIELFGCVNSSQLTLSYISYRYWESLELSSFERVGLVALGTTNNGSYTFQVSRLHPRYCKHRDTDV